MLLRITKKLTEESAVRVKNIIKKTNFLYSLPDGAFLENDAKTITITWEKGGWSQSVIEQEMEPFITPLYELARVERGSIYSPTWLKNPRISQLKFVIDLSRWHMQHYSSSVNLYVQDNMKHLVLFRMFSDGSKKERNIFSIATFFYNKLPMYKEIYELL